MRRVIMGIRRVAGWVLVSVGGVMLVSCLICMLLTPMGKLEVSSTGEAVGVFISFALMGGINALLLMLGWRMRGMGPVMRVPLRCHMQRLRLWLHGELSRKKGKEARLLRPKSLNRPVLLEKGIV
ncbi:MAG: hypothetical protein ACI4ML_09790 [Aristaeellaceae bacterium]